MDREPPQDMSWGGASTAGGASGGWSGDSWGGGGGIDLDAPAPSTSFGGGSSWGGGSADSWSDVSTGGLGGGAASGWANGPASAPAPPSPPPAATSPAPSNGGGGGWLGAGGDQDDGWGGSTPMAKAAPTAPAPAPAAPQSNGWLGGGGDETSDGWGGGSTMGGGGPTQKMGGIADSGPTLGGGDTFGGSSPPASNGGWLGDSDDGFSGAAAEESQDGWLGSGGTATVESQPDSGWLADGPSGPSMTEMVDRAIGVEEADDFVDDSWVDEEIREGEYDDLEVPEYQPPAPEVGGVFVKMLLVAVLVILVGGGIVFLQKDTKTPEQIAAEELQIARQDARSFVKTGNSQMENGQADAAVFAYKSALEKMDEIEAPAKEVLDTQVLLGQAYLQSGQYTEAHAQWTELASGPEEYQAQAKKAILESNKGLRVEANEDLAKGLAAYKNGESNNVIVLGQHALEIFENHGGNQVQQGRAHGIIGRGYLNGYDYANARTHLVKARTLNPKGDYKAELAKAAAGLAAPRQRSSRYKPKKPRRTKRVIKASITTEKNYKTSSGYSVRRPRRAAPKAAPKAAPAAQPAQRRMKEIKAYARPKARAPKRSGRKGQKGVVNGYNS